jgi:Histidine kinase-, DNA gyrase B-, and HSP90-like ATPase
MEVTQTNDHVTHAVIGGNATINMGISDSAEFFNILSSTLYTDQKLAVVREVLCNAWDAHVDAGITDRAVKVEISREKIVIQDFGCGIHKDMIGPIYGVYGNSTKKHDGKQTGGFGLGCKAPFAYTEHFEVISCHHGIKTIYSMSKSSAEVKGKPGITPIASFPTTETGMTITINMKQMNDSTEFVSLVRRIVANGDMNVELNGEQLDTIPFSTMKHDFLITWDHVYPTKNQAIYVRYGHVIYPVDTNSHYQHQYNKINEFLQQLPHTYNKINKIIFQAPAHSISVTPSREALSMQDHTIKTLQNMFALFLDRLDKAMKIEASKVMKERIESCIMEEKIGLLFDPVEKIPNISAKDEPDDKLYIVDFNSLTRRHIRAHYPKYEGFRTKDILQRIDTLIASNCGPRGLLQSYRSSFIKESKRPSHDPDSWLLRKVVAPLVQKMKGTELIPERLMVYGHGLGRKWHYDTGKILPVCHADKAARLEMEYYLPYLRNIIVLSYSRVDIEDRIGKFPEIKDALCLNTGYLLYVVPRSQKKAEAARQFFAETGMAILDCTLSQPWEPSWTAEPVERTPPKPKKKGYACFSSAIQDENYSLQLCRADDATRIENPRWFARVPGKNREGVYPNHLGKLSANATKIVVTLFGSMGAVTTTSSQEENLKDKGVKPLDVWIREEVANKIQSSPIIQNYLTYAHWRVFDFTGIDAAESEIYHMCMKIPMLRKEFGLVNEMTQEDRRYLTLYREFTRYVHEERDFPLLVEARKFVQSLPIAIEAVKLRNKIVNNDLLKLLDIDKVHRILTSNPTFHADKIDSTMQILRITMQ